jgi:ABC-type uncharacterized transport system substrate-binding protein
MKHSKTILIIILLLSLIVSGTASAQSDQYTVGIWNFMFYEGFIGAMADLGYVEGENVSFLYTEDGQDDMDTAQALIDAHVDVIIIQLDTSALTLMEMTSEIPIVFYISDDPVATGAVESLLNPGRNATGLVTNHSHVRRFQLLPEVNPATDKVYYLPKFCTNGQKVKVTEQDGVAGNSASAVPTDRYPG